MRTISSARTAADPGASSCSRISAKPTLLVYGAVRSSPTLVSAMRRSRRENFVLGNVTVCPAAVRDASPRSTVTGAPPSNERSTLVTYRWFGPTNGCTRFTWSVVIGWSRSSRRRSPITSACAPTCHDVLTSSSNARAPRYSGW